MAYGLSWMKVRKSVQFVGEGDFTFTVAFAALRKVSGSERKYNPGVRDGIIASRYDSQKPVFKDVQDACKENCNKQCRV